MLLDVATPEERRVLNWDESDCQRKRGWYRLDRNAVPAQHDLRARSTAEVDEVSHESWRRIEATIGGILARCVEKLRWERDDPRRFKYELSATHHEILAGAMAPPAGGAGVLAFFRQIHNFDNLLGDLPQPAARDLVDTNETGSFDSAAHEKVEKLKEELRSKPHVAAFEFGATWTNGHLDTDLYTFGRHVFRSLAKSIQEAAPLDRAPALVREIERHEQFCAEKSAGFRGQTRIVTRIESYVRGRGDATATQPFAICGRLGAGKSAIMARSLSLIQHSLPGAELSASDVVVAARFIGATPESCEAESLLSGLCEEVAGALGIPIDAHRADLGFAAPQGIVTRQAPYGEEAYARFRSLLARVPETKTLVVFLDGLDGLEPTGNSHALNWLPADLRPNVRLVVSVMGGDDGGECIRAIEQKLPESNIQPVPPLETSVARDLLQSWLAGVNRTLQNTQSDYVMARFAGCATPLYLRLAFEMARTWKSYQPIEDGISLEPDVPAMVAATFSRLESSGHHAESMVSRTLAYLITSRHGLSESDLVEMVSADETVLSDFRRRSPQSPNVDHLPLAPWIRFYEDISPLLSSRKANGFELLAPQNAAVTAAAKARAEKIGLLAIHASLAAHFKRQDSIQSARPFDAQRRMIQAEMLWHLCEANDWETLAPTLTSLLLSASGKAAQEPSEPFLHENEVIRYWARIEESSRFTFLKSVQHVLESPESYSDEVVQRVAVLLLRRNMAQPSDRLLSHLADRFRRAGQVRELAWALHRRVESLYLQHDGHMALKLLEQEAEIWRQLGDEDGLRYCLLNRAHVLGSAGQPAEAYRIYCEQEPYFRTRKDLLGINVCLNNRVKFETERGNTETAMDLLRECEEIDRAFGDDVALAQTMCNQGWVLRRLGLHAIAERSFADAQRVFQDWGELEGLSVCLGNRAAIAEDLGRPESAVPMLKEQARICQQTGYDEGLLRALANLAKVLGIVLGRPDEARPFLLEAMVLCNKHGFREYGAKILAIQRELWRLSV